METVKVEVTNISNLQQELAEIQTTIKQAEDEESKARDKMEGLEKLRNRGENRGTFAGQKMPPRDGRSDRRDSRRGRDNRYRDRRRGGERRGRDRGRRDRFGRRELDRREQAEDKNFYGLARSQVAEKKTNRRRAESEEKGPAQTYKSKYADAESSSEEEEELPPTQMISLVTVDSDKEDGEKSGASDSDSDSESASESAKVKEEPTPTRGRKRGRDSKGDVDRKRRRVNILASMKNDKKNHTRSKRLFGFMMKHLGRAKKESKDKPDLQNSITKKAQELKTQQKRVIDKAFQEKQKEKYEARLEFQRKTLEVQQWKKKHIENLLRADGMKKEFKLRCDLIESGVFLTTSSPPITWQTKEELDKEFMVSMQEKCKEGLQVNLDKEIQDMMDNEGEEPEEPEPLPHKYKVSPIRGRRDDDEQDGNNNRKGRFGTKREGGFPKRDGGFNKREGGFNKREGGFNKREGGFAKREEVSRRDRSRERDRGERGFRGPKGADRRGNRMQRKEITTSNLRHRRREPAREAKEPRSPPVSPKRKRVKEEPTVQPSMMSLVSVAED